MDLVIIIMETITIMSLLNFAGFTISVWAALIAGFFLIAMVIGCNFDRHHHEAPKWWILIIAAVTFCAWQWPNLSWRTLISRELWSNIGIYLLIGLAYSILEFALDVRRSARYWKAKWIRFQVDGPNHLRGMGGTVIPKMSDFFKEQNHHLDDRRLVTIEMNKSKGVIVPKVNRNLLAENIGCWTFFWPFYAISLIVGDLLTEIFKLIADFIASISGRAVNAAFRNVFK
jgi:hypothetical protein